MSLSCSRGQLARWSGLGGAATAGACCGRPLDVVADLMAALWGSRGGLEGSGEWMRTGVALQVSKGQGPEAANRVQAHAKRALWARPVHARLALDEMPARVRELG